MADPIAITSLIIEISKIIPSLINYAKAVQDSRSDAQKLTEELFTLKGILEHLSAQIVPRELKGPLSKPQELCLFNPELMTTTLAKTDETLKSLLVDLEEPAGKHKRLKQKLEWPFAHEKFKAHLVRLERVKTCLILVLTSDSSALQRDLHSKLADLATSLEENLKIRNEERISTSRRDLCHWLAPSSPTRVHLRVSKARLGQTGKWFIDRIFNEWLRGHDEYRRTLFLVGKSGSGKTTLFSRAVDELVSISAHAPSVAFGYFYCSFSDVASQDPTNIFGSLLVQLSGSNPSVLERIWPLYEARANSIGGEYSVDIADIEDAIIEHMSGDKPVILLVDAINESNHAENIKRSLRKLISNLSNLRVLLTCQTAVASSEHASIININAANIKDDIEAFILSRLQEDEMLKGLSLNLKHQIWQTITQGADGSFRWAQLSLENLSSLRTFKAIREALQTLPGTLRETYVSVLQRIPASDWELSRTAFLWLCFSKRSLTLDELNEAVVLEETSTIIDEDMKLVCPEILLEICQGLITKDALGKVHLAHASVKDFLTSEWIHSSSVQYFSLDPATADKTLMRQCLTYLCLDNFRSGYAHSIDSILEREEEHPLLDYAANFWASHSYSRNFDDRDYQIVNKLFFSRHLPRCGNFGVWVQTLAPEIDVERIEATQPLYYAASFGLVPVVRAILESATAVNVDAPGGRFGSTPLYVACWWGNHEVVELLLQAGADPYYPDASTGLTAFSLPMTSKSARMKEILSKVRLKGCYGPTKHATSEDLRIGTCQKAESRALYGDNEGNKVGNDDDQDPLGTGETDINQRPARSFSVVLSCPIPTLKEFLAQVMGLYPRLEPALAQRFAQEQCRRYERLAMLQQKHSQDVISHSCRSGKHCTALGHDAATMQRQQESISSQADDFTPGYCQGGGIDLVQFPPGVPLPPVSALPAQFECPICFEVKKFLKPSDWLKHVNEDVQPFTCTVRNCSELKSFKRKADWIRHEMVQHRQQEYWDCSFSECGFTCGRKDNFVQHLVREHGLLQHKTRKRKTSLPEEPDSPEASMETLWEIVEQRRRKTDNSQEDRCQFCGENFESWKKLMRHLETHLVELAMPVLEMVKRRVAS